MLIFYILIHKLKTCGLFESSKFAGGVGLGLGFRSLGGLFLIGGPKRKERSGGGRFLSVFELFSPFLRFLG